jgi:hypothetical protein
MVLHNGATQWCYTMVLHNGATQWCYTDPNAGLQKALFCWVFRLGQATGGEGGILIRRLRKPKEPNEIRLRQQAGFCFVATIVYHLVCDGNHQI